MEKNLPGKRISKYFAALLLAALCLGCAPTYPKEKLIESLTDICKKEYSAQIQVKLVGKTIVVFIPLKELFDQQLNILPDAVKKIEDVVLGTSRVIFSSDTPIDFYTIIARDTKTDVEMVMTRYVQDVYKFMYSWIPREEYRKRILWQVDFNPLKAKRTQDELNAQEMLLQPFLAQQIAQRLNFFENYPVVFRVKIKGNYNEQNKQFEFSMVAADKKIFQNNIVPQVLNEVAVVFRYYKLDDFISVKISNIFDKDSVVVDRADLKKYLSVKKKAKK